MHLIVSRKMLNERETTLRSFYFLQNVDKQSNPDTRLHTCEPVLPFPFPHKCGFAMACACLVKASL